ncbi:MAG TPA: SpoIIE family protein phosphatase [Candidatus Acidoferrum sp.]|jgi:serine phosphatase RsbU (regulator of sigma subunit)|nr:SpoIIE family protein phosphatase [Candidatus Acidoferrum sp.]
MNIFLNATAVFAQAVAPAPQIAAELRWQLASIVIGVAILSAGLAGLALYFLQRKTRERSLVFFSLFALLYAIRLIFRQSFVQSLALASPDFWSYFDKVIDCVIEIPLALFLIETLETRWQTFLRWLLAFQIAFGAARFLSFALRVGNRPIETAHGIFLVIICGLFFAIPFSFGRGRRLTREFQVLYAGLAVFFVFVIQSNLRDLRLIRVRGLEPIGFLVLVCCLGYIAVYRSFSKEQRLLSIEKELEVARRIQSSILPREVPAIAGLDIAARYVPMTAVAGDFYDFILLDEKRIGILVADVTGHGVPAALIASMLKVSLAGQSTHAGDPAQVLTGLNQSLCGKFEEHFVTAIYLFVDAERQIFRYAGAGHPPLLFGSIDGGRPAAFREIESNGLLLGISEGAAYSAVESTFRPGDRCILYTDGVLEAKNAAQEEFGLSRFARFLETQSNVAAAALVDALLTELKRWTGKSDGGVQEDDITLVAVDFERSAFLREIPGNGKQPSPS